MPEKKITTSNFSIIFRLFQNSKIQNKIARRIRSLIVVENTADGETEGGAEGRAEGGAEGGAEG